MNVLLVAKVHSRVPSLQSALAQSDCNVVATLSDTLDLQRQVRSCNPDIVIIDIDTPDRDTLGQVGLTIQEESRPVVMFADDDNTATIRGAVEAGVSAYVFDGMSAARIRPIIDTAVARFEQIQALRRALAVVENRLSERKFIERAKGYLMKRRNLTEDDAYRALRKKAMDNHIAVAQVARQVIAIEEVL